MLNRADGAIGNPRTPHYKRRWGRSSDEEMVIPAGVVKFSNPDADEENSILRNPVERGYCWGTVQDQIVSHTDLKRLEYENDVQRAATPKARVPLCIVQEGKEAIIAYLAAHDHRDHFLGRFLELDSEEVRSIIQGMQTRD